MASIDLEPGFRLGKYEVLQHLASGGMGAVYKAVDRELNRLVALKLLPVRVAEDDLAIERFRREARHAARLNHPNIVTLYEFGSDRQRGLLFLAFEFIHGIDLAAHIAQRGCLRPEEARRILLQVVRALGHAYDFGVVHRDIKPSNLMLAQVNGRVRVKLTDFGLAISKGEDDFRVTREGSTVGTIDYLSPEQARDSQSADTRSDIYSLGCTAYHMLVGKAPFSEGGLGERLFKHLETPPRDVRLFNPAVTAGFWAIIEKMLAKKPADRFPNPFELLNALKRTPADASKPPIQSAKRVTEHVATATTEVTVKPADQKTATGITSEQTRAAAALFERAIQVLAQGTGDDYGRKLLDSCLRLDPFHLAARKTLRTLSQQDAGGLLKRWLGSLNVLATKSKMRLARAAGDWRTVLEQGEQVLAQVPADVDTHIELAETATELGVPDLAHWYLEQGCRATPHGADHAKLLRALGRLHEHLHHWKSALLLWQRVAALEPDNVDAAHKVDELVAKEYLASGPPCE
jgi:hypothetical protein